MDAERLERAARAAFEEWMRREEPSYDCSEEALFSTFFDGYRAALAAQPAQAGEAVALCDAPVGIFRTIDGHDGFKTEYHRQDGSVEAYCLDSGEAWWGRPPQTAASQRAELVVPVAFTHPAPRAEPASAEAVREACVAALLERRKVQSALMMDAHPAVRTSASIKRDIIDEDIAALSSLPLPTAPASAEAVADSIIDAIVAETRAHLERMERLWGDLSRAASSPGGA